jgi:saccharopine dehydrogenase-like NADP-dependent oxidoreductase
MQIFTACEQEGVNYVDMAMSLSKANPDDPTNKVGVMLGDEQFARDESFAAKGIYALVGIGVEPGLSDVFARYAADNLFSRIDSAIVYDGSNLVVEGYDFAPTFSIWTTIEECLNPPLMWESGRGWYTTEAFSDLESFDFPDGIGPVECVNVEHEEVALIPRKIDAGRVAFKYGLGSHFINILKTIHTLGLDKVEPVNVQGVSVSPRNVLAALLPDPATLGPLMSGKTCAGIQVKGLDKSGAPKAVYIYNVVDNAFSMGEFGDQAVVWQTAINPLIALELIERGDWKPTGVNGPEWFPAEPFLELLASYGTSWHIREESTAGIVA